MPAGNTCVPLTYDKEGVISKKHEHNDAGYPGEARLVVTRHAC